MVANFPIYRVTASNWSTIQTEITNYDSDDITDITDDWFYSGSTWTVLLPGNGNTGIGTAWQGYGLEAWDGSEGIYGELETKIKGGILSGSGAPDPSNQAVYQTSPDAMSGDPIDMLTGNYFYNHEDIAVGSGGFPYRLSVQRYYNSGNRYSNGPLGLGWTHSFNTSATVNSDAFLAAGQRSPFEAAATIAAAYVIVDLYTDTTRGIANVLSTALISSWLMQNQWWHNTVIVSTPDTAQTFVLLADGTYNAPLANANTLTLASGSYSLTTPQQIMCNFASDGALATIVYPSGPTITLTYSSGLLQTVSNGMGRTLTFSYSGEYISSISDGNGRSVSYIVDSDNNLTVFTNALSNNRTYSYDPSNPGLLLQWFKPANPTTAVTTNTFDSLVRVQSQSNARNQQWVYYLAGSRAEVDDPLSNPQIYYFNNQGSVVREINALGNEIDKTYDGLNRLIQATLPEGNYVLLTYDSLNNLLSATGVPKSGSGLSNLITSFTYNATYNKVHTFQDANGNTTTFNYNSATGTLASVSQPIIGGSTPEVSFTYNSRGQVLTVTDQTGIVTQFNYDTGTEKLTSSVMDYGTGRLNLTSNFGYDSVGNITSVQDPNGNTTTFEFDEERRPTQKTAPSPLSYVTNIAYDDNNNLISLERQTNDTPIWQTNTIAYSVTDKPTTITDPLGRLFAWTYDAKDRPETYTDAQSREWQYAYDAIDRLYTITDPSTTVSFTFSYTSNGRLYQLADARSKTTTYSYDGFDRIYRTSYADSSYEEYETYDANGNVLTYVTRSGNTIVNTYDALNRLSTKAPQGQATVTYGYDLAGRLTSISTPVVSGNPATGEFQFAFDTAGRFYQETTPDSKTITYELDSNANITKLTYPDGYYLERAYNVLNKLTYVYLNGSSTAALQFGYDALSRRTSLSYGNGALINYGYENNNDLIELQHQFNATTSLTYTYGYTNTHQEISRSLTDTTFMWHPSAGGTVSYSTASSVNEYPTVGGSSYSYDGNGNLSGNGTWTYSFDTENHLLSASMTGTSASYVYDGCHRQIQKSVGSAETRYVYTGFQRIADYNGSTGALENRYVYGTRLDEPLIMVSSGGTPTFLHADRQGSIICTTDSSGNVSNKNQYGPFGEGAAIAGSTFGYTGQRYDSETGLYYFKRRHYSSGLGRFLQPDPIGYGSSNGLNLYGYAADDPLNATDPLGLDAVYLEISGAAGSTAPIIGPFQAAYHVGIVVEISGTYWAINAVQQNFSTVSLEIQRYSSLAAALNPWLPQNGQGTMGFTHYQLGNTIVSPCDPSGSEDALAVLRSALMMQDALAYEDFSWAAFPTLQNLFGLGQSIGLYNGGVNSNQIAASILDAAGVPVPSTFLGFTGPFLTPDFAPSTQLESYVNGIEDLMGPFGWGLTTPLQAFEEASSDLNVVY